MNVQVQLVGLWGPLNDLVAEMPLIVQSKPVSKVHVPDALLPATELVDLHVTFPLQTQVSDVPKRLSVHVTPPLLVKLRVPERLLPSALLLPLKSDLGHLVLRPLPSVVQLELVELAVMFVLTGVKVAWAGRAEVARMANARMVSIGRRFMGVFPFLGRNRFTINPSLHGYVGSGATVLRAPLGCRG